MSYYEIGEDKKGGGKVSKGEALAPVPPAPTAPTTPAAAAAAATGETPAQPGFLQKQIVGPVKVWHAGAGVLGAVAAYFIFRKRP